MRTHELKTQPRNHPEIQLILLYVESDCFYLPTQKDDLKLGFLPSLARYIVGTWPPSSMLCQFKLHTRVYSLVAMVENKVTGMKTV